jgi:hypothetical protein
MLFSTWEAANCGSRQAELKLSDEEMKELCSPSPQLIIATTNTAIEGASHCHAGMRRTMIGSATSSMTAAPDSKILALRAADGRRGVQERKRVSS